MKRRVPVIVASVFVSLLVLVITLLSTVAVHNMFLAAPFDSIARISVAVMMFVLGALSLTGLWYLFDKP